MSLPVIEMKNPDLPKEVLEKYDQEAEQITDEVIYGEESSEEELVIEEEDKPDEPQIFDKPKEVEQVEQVEQLEQESLAKEIGEPVKEAKGKRKYERKKPMSQKQLDHLAKIRAIGVEKRKVRAEEAKQKKLLDQESQAEERLLKKKEKEEDDKILKEAKAKKSAMVKGVSAPLNQSVPLAYSQADLEKAMLKAVETYDTQRKVRKVAKKKKQAEDLKESNKMKVIQNAINPNMVQAPAQDQWRHLFG
tara:strand:+ start:1761 stop:2504 length:744 start_codon:yes stop_codon:yes gene_type:complete